MPKVKSNLKPGAHWQDIHFHSHIMMDAQAKHLLGCAPFGMTDIGEVMEIYCQLSDSNEEQMGGYQVGSEFIGDWIADNL